MFCTDDVLQVLPLVHSAIFPRADPSIEDAFDYDDESAMHQGDGGEGGPVDLAVCVDAPDGRGSNGVMVMAGFWAARRCAERNSSSSNSAQSRGKACTFLSDVLTRCQTATEDAHDQHSFNIVLSNYAKRSQISFAFLDTSKFLNGTFRSQFAVEVCSLTRCRALLFC